MNHGSVCLLVSVLGSTQRGNILNEKKLFGYDYEAGPGDLRIVLKQIGPLGKNLWIDALNDTNDQYSCTCKTHVNSSKHFQVKNL